MLNFLKRLMIDEEDITKEKSIETVNRYSLPRFAGIVVGDDLNGNRVKVDLSKAKCVFSAIVAKKEKYYLGISNWIYECDTCTIMKTETGAYIHLSENSLGQLTFWQTTLKSAQDCVLSLYLWCRDTSGYSFGRILLDKLNDEINSLEQI